MAERWTNPELSPEEQREVERKQDARRTQQPYATELDNRELEHAHKDKRPAESPDEKPGNS